ncbi:hypothetical protein Egran_06225, partial [Elaphomyces granulatus]
MCLGESGFTYRGTCTDRTFASDNCPSLCHIDPISQRTYKRITNLYLCGTPGIYNNTFCCESFADTPQQSCCATNFTYNGSGFAFSPGRDAELALISSASAAIANATSAAIASATSTTIADATGTAANTM